MALAPYLRYPAISGELVAFAADDDLWLADPAGGRASRLTADGAPLAGPRFSPSGELLAYTGRRDGAPEAYLVGVGGEPTRRLSYLGDPFTRVIGWADEEHVLLVSAAGEPFRSRTWAYAVPVAGGPMERLGYGPISSLARGPSGEVVLGVNQSNRRGAAWKRYRGGTAAALWIGREAREAAGPPPGEAGEAGTGAVFSRFLAGIDGQLEDPSFVGDRLAFLSDHEGIANCYSVLPDGSDLRRHSDHAEHYARALSGDGRRLVYQCGGDLYLLEDLDPGAPRRIEVTLGAPRRGRLPFRPKAEDHLGGFAPDREGRASLVEARGAVHLVTHEEGPAPLLGGGAGVRARLPLVVGRGEGAVAVFVTDAEGADALELVPLAAGPGAAAGSRRLAAGQLGRVLELAGAPDGSLLAVATHDGRLLTVEVASGEVRTLARSGHGDASGLSFSPDSSLLAWSQAGPEPLRQLLLARLADGEVVEATPMRFDDREPVFTLDGRYLAFLSVRTFDPVYDTHVFDLAFPAGTRPYLLCLAAATPSPFDPEPGGRPRRGAPSEPPRPEGPHPDASPSAEAPASAPAQGGDDGGPARVEPVVVDLDGLAERVVPVPVAAGRLSGLSAVAGGLAWMVEPVLGVLGEERERPGAPAHGPGWSASTSGPAGSRPSSRPSTATPRAGTAARSSSGTTRASRACPPTTGSSRDRGARRRPRWSRSTSTGSASRWTPPSSGARCTRRPVG